MPKYDVTRASILNDTAPTVTLPSTFNAYENREAVITGTINTGRPAANEVTYSFHNTLADANNNVNPLSGENAITAVIAPALPSTDNTNQTITITFIAPDVDSLTTLNQALYLRVNANITGQGDRNATGFGVCSLSITNSIHASVDIASSFTHYEITPVILPMTFNPGSPTATEFRHSWHPTAQDALDDTNEITSDVPTATFSHTAFSVLAGRAVVATEGGSVRYTTPGVNTDTTFHCRLEIIQEGVVRDFDTYAITIENSVDPSISIPNYIVEEGALLRILIYTYNSGAPYSDEIDGSWHSTQADADSGANPITTGIPTTATIFPQTPVQNAEPQQGSISTFYWPYVDSDTDIYFRIWIRQGTRIFYDTSRITILNRVVANIDMPESVQIPERGTVVSTGSYTTGIPSATAIGVRVYATETDADNEQNELTGENNPLTIALSTTTPNTGGDRTSPRDLVATITAPAVTRDETYYLRWWITQSAILPDP